jgi:hypothetical protein
MPVYDPNAPTIPKPTKYAGNPILTAGDMPYERPWNRIQSPVLVKAWGQYWLYYLQQFDLEPPNNSLFWLCYATASHPLGPYTKPQARALNGQVCNGLFEAYQGFGMFYDPTAEAIRGAGGHQWGETRNGLHWRVQANWFVANDTNTSLIRHEPFAVSGGKPIIGMVRDQATWTPGGAPLTTLRRVAIVDAGDWTPYAWSNKMPIQEFDAPAPDGTSNNRWEQPYALAVQSYGEYVFGLLWWLHLDQDAGNNNVGVTDAELVWVKPAPGETNLRNYTAPGSWHRTRQAFIERGPEGSSDYGAVAPGQPLIDGDTVYIPYVAAANKHGVSPAQLSICMATMPKADLDEILNA